jgi:uncharacterized protein
MYIRRFASAAPDTLTSMIIPAFVTFVLIATLLFIYARFIEPSWLRIRHRVVPISGWSKANDGLRILHLSDLHVGRSTGRVRRFVARAAAVPADIIVITGDFVDHPKYVPLLADVLLPLTERGQPVIAILGNHDRFAYAQRFIRSHPHAYDSTELIEAVRAAGIDLMIDETRTVATRVGDIRFVGIDISSHNGAGLMHTLQGGSVAGAIMLAHSPDAIPAAAEAGIGLLLCGHTHGGQVRIGPWFTPMTSTRLRLKPPSGIIKRRSTVTHVSPGLGITFLPFRFFARPEATVIEVIASG